MLVVANFDYGHCGGGSGHNPYMEGFSCQFFNLIEFTNFNPILKCTVHLIGLDMPIFTIKRIWNPTLFYSIAIFVSTTKRGLKNP